MTADERLEAIRRRVANAEKLGDRFLMVDTIDAVELFRRLDAPARELDARALADEVMRRLIGEGSDHDR